MEKIRDELTKKIENNLRFVITISIFFLAIFEQSKIQGSIIIVAYIISYIIFEIREKEFDTRNLKWINTALLAGLGSYTVPLFVLALSTQERIMQTWEIYTFKGSIITAMFTILIAPMATLLMTIFLSINIRSFFLSDRI